ncbi:MAG: hypothetical protein HF962_00505 [Sulfurovum sp.]|nr:hypothetical protein [Sulfurovum sp.]
MEVIDTHGRVVTDPRLVDKIIYAAERGKDRVKTDWGEVIIRKISRPSGLIKKIEVLI